MKKVKFCFGIHNHQPVGNFGWVIEDAYQKAYLPFLQLLEHFPRIRISLHFSGILLGWIKVNHPECIDLLRRLLERGQLELLTGGYYEPILPIIPDRDKHGQIQLLTEFLAREFSFEASGMWLAERVWEPQLPLTLAGAGVKYTILDDIHFRFAGLEESELDGYFVTEEQGRSIGLFPISRELRYAIPFAEPQVTIDYLQEVADARGGGIGIYADDGEKFGVWPDTYKHCYEDRWLERFFTLICDNLDWIEMTTFGEALAACAPKGLVYLPTASYSEMNEWALPAEVIEKYEGFVAELKRHKLYDDNIAFVKGGYWRNFLTKYPESNNLYQRMLAVSDLLESAKGDLASSDYARAQQHLYAGQCNCPYWHGVFGGLYLPHLRGAVYEELIAAESIILSAISGKVELAPVRTIEAGFDCTKPQYVIGSRQKVTILPAEGALIAELDHFPTRKNLVDLIGRRKEGYHHKLIDKPKSSSQTRSIHDLIQVKEEGLAKLLVPDRYRRGLFVDHLLALPVAADELQALHFDEILSFRDGDHTEKTDIVGDLVTLSYSRRRESTRGDVSYNLELHKAFEIRKESAGVTVHYRLTNFSSHPCKVWFGCELGFGSFPFPPEESQLKTSGNRLGNLLQFLDHTEVTEAELISGIYNLRVSLQWRSPANFAAHPLWTVSLSEGGFEKVCQGIILLPHWYVSLAPSQEWLQTVKMSVLSE